MNLSRPLFAAALLLSLAIPSHASSKPKTPAATEPTTPVTPHVVQAVDAAHNSVVIVNHLDRNSTHTYKLDDLTKITVNGQTGKIADIKAGMVVTDLLERDNDDLDGITLSGYAPATAPKPAAPTPKKKSAPTT